MPNPARASSSHKALTIYRFRMKSGRAIWVFAHVTLEPGESTHEVKSSARKVLVGLMQCPRVPQDRRGDISIVDLGRTTIDMSEVESFKVW